MHANTTTKIETDICIIGGGPIGLAFALAAATRLSLRVTVLETAPTPPVQLTTINATANTLDSRVYALSPASCALLAQLGAWQTMAAARLQVVNSMRIWGDSGRGDSESPDRSLNASSPPDLELGAMANAASTIIATMVEHNHLLDGLWQKVREQANISVVFAARPTVINVVESAVFVGFTDNDAVEKMLQSKLLVGADGVNSWVRRQAGFDAVGTDYSASAVVANFQCELAHGYAARQWFLGQSVLALLPLPDASAAKTQHPDAVIPLLPLTPHEVSMVWSCEHAHAARVMASADLAVEVSAQHGMIGAELGRLTLIGAPRKFPLSRRGAAQFVKPCVVLLGDAAHSVHPLAGQGANLGFGDVVALTETLATCGKFSNIGDLSLLQRYQRSRREHSTAVTLVTDGLYKLNRATNVPAQWLRHQGLQVLNRSQIVKRAMIGAATN